METTIIERDDMASPASAAKLHKSPLELWAEEDNVYLSDAYESTPFESKHPAGRDQQTTLSFDDMSLVSGSTYYTALSHLGARNVKIVPGQLREEDEYAQLLQSKKLWPVHPDLEENWSGRGEHLELVMGDQDFLDQTLKLKRLLGQSNSARVESVKCRRIMLARKTISCTRHFTKEQAIEEVSHLKKLRHAHIVRVIGTYVLGRSLSILIYPVARYNLSHFLKTMERESRRETQDIYTGKKPACKRFFSCLSSALDHIHCIFMKHMDIKPQNILVQVIDRRDGQNPLCVRPSYEVFIADFGIARSYKKFNETNTDGPMMFTPKYAAPEVVNQEQRGLPADIFSLGCVFLEMMAALGGSASQTSWSRSLKHRLQATKSIKSIILTTEILQACLEESPGLDSSYHRNVATIRDELSATGSWQLCGGPLDDPTMTKIILSMLSEDPKARPWANQMLDHFGSHFCCKTGPVELETHKP